MYQQNETITFKTKDYDTRTNFKPSCKVGKECRTHDWSRRPIELCEDGILVDHIGTKNNNVINYFKGMTLTDFEYDEICNCSYYSYAR